MKGAKQNLVRAAILVAVLAAAGAVHGDEGQPEPATAPGPSPDAAPVQAVSAPTATVPALASDGTSADQQPAKPKPVPIEPRSVRPLVPVEAGRNDLNPVWSPRGTFIAFERSVGEKKEIRLCLPDGTPLQTVYHLLSAGRGDLQFFFPGLAEETSYNAGLSWSPDEYRILYMSNGGEGNYDLYVQDLGAAPVRITDHKEKDGQSQWSPVEDRIVFVSGRSGNGDLYRMDLGTRKPVRITRGGKAYLYPQWSPDGSRVAAMYGSNENHDIVVIDIPEGRQPSQKALTAWAADDLRPVWSPDGSKIAFYTNYNAAGDPRTWSIAVVPADGSGPIEGSGLAERIVAEDVVPDVEAGPAWMPDSARIVFVKNDRQEYNPLYVADVAAKTATPIRTDTKMNHDVACSAEGLIAFRSQVNQWDQIFIMQLKE